MTSGGRMHRLLGSALQRARLLGTQFFYRFGMCVCDFSLSTHLFKPALSSHCATHQIRLILVSSVVITSLLFPAIASYYSSQNQYFAGFTLRVLDSFLTPDDISSYFAQHDLRHLWEGDPALRVRADSVARARCGMEGIVREERVLVGSVSPEEGLGALDKSTLLATLKLERRIAEAMASRGLPCLQTRSGSCFVLTPSVFWNHDERSLASDEHILNTINFSQNVSISGVPISPDMVLAGRELQDPTSHRVDAAMFLVLTYFFPEKDCFGNDGHFQWLHALEDAGGGSGELVVLAQEPQLIALEVRLIRILQEYHTQYVLCHSLCQHPATVPEACLLAQPLFHPYCIHVCDVHSVQHLLFQAISTHGHGALSHRSRVHWPRRDCRQYHHQCQCLCVGRISSHDGPAGVIPYHTRVHWRGEHVQYRA